MIETFNNNGTSDIRPSRRLSSYAQVILLGFIAVGIIWGWYWYQSTRPAEYVSEDLNTDQVISGNTGYTFTYTIVPDAETRIVLDRPMRDAATTQSDRRAYDKIRSDMASGTIPLLRDAQVDSPYSLGIMPISALTMLEEHEMSELLFRVHDELQSLVAHFNVTLQSQNPVERGVADSVTLPYEAAANTVAPSAHIVTALFFGDIMKSDTPVDMHAGIDEEVSHMIDRGIAYGLYASSDVVVSRDLYNRYKELVRETRPELTSVLYQAN